MTKVNPSVEFQDEGPVPRIRLLLAENVHRLLEAAPNAAPVALFTGAIPLPLDAGAFACGVATLSQCTPHYGFNLDQNGYPILAHIDAELSVDARST